MQVCKIFEERKESKRGEGDKRREGEREEERERRGERGEGKWMI